MKRLINLLLILLFFIPNFCSLNKTGLSNYNDLNSDSDADSDADSDTDTNTSFDIQDDNKKITDVIMIDKVLDINTIETDVLSVCHFCGTDEECCSGNCVNLKTDAQNCEFCGNICNNDEVCRDGLCKQNCGNLTNCSGVCADLFSDKNNCGQCGNVCDQNKICQNSACKLQCDNLTECNGTCVDIYIDKNNCGRCGVICEDFMDCIDGSCVTVECVTECAMNGLFCCSDQYCHQCCNNYQCRDNSVCHDYFCIEIM